LGKGIVMKPIRRSKLLLYCGFFVFLFAGCSEVAITGRTQLNFIPDSMINSLSAEAYNEFLTKHKLSTDTQQSRMVERVGRRIASAVERYCREQGLPNRVQGYQWQFTLVEDPNVNAWAMPGGKVVVYTGLLAVAKTDAGLATVLAHEIGHVFARHGAERMSQSLLVEFGGMALSRALETRPAETKRLFMRSYGIGTQLGFLLPYSRLQESEADRLGLIFMAMAGYDPHEAIAFWKRMSALNKSQRPPELLSTHPADSTRIRNIESLIPEAMRYYRAD